MPRVQRTPNLLQRLARLEGQVEALRRAGWERDELPFYPTSFYGLLYDDRTVFTTVWETLLSPRTASLALGMVLIGDVVSSLNTGGDWQVVLGSTVVATGSIPPTFSYVFPALSLDLLPYRTTSLVKVQIQVRRTAGASTGGRYGGGGSIGCSPRYALLI